MPAGLLKQLDDLALRHEETRNDCAKRLVIEAMTQSWLERLQQRLEESDGRLEKLREDLATVLAMMLVEFGKEDAERVKKWVREHLLR
jgi:hypothetical protein